MLLFLDIDGVLNNAIFNVEFSIRFQRQMALGFDPENMKALNEIIRETDCKLVISSSWRMYLRDGFDLQAFTFLLSTHGCNGEVVGSTCYEGAYRGWQIQQYLKENPTDRYVVLDDDSDIRDPEHFVKVSNRVGLTMADAYDAIEILNGQDSRSGSRAD